MFYVARNQQGAIQSLSETADATHREALAADHPDVFSFMKRHHSAASEISALSDTDLGFIRVLDDLIDLLIEKDLLQFTELPTAAQNKLLARRSMRESLSNLSTSSTLLAASDEDEALI